MCKQVERAGPPARRDVGFRVVQPKVVEVDVSPADGLSVHQPDHDLPAQVAGKIDGDALEVLAYRRRRPGR